MSTQRQLHASESKQVWQVTYVGMVLNILLALIKIVIGYLGHSRALIADGVHSLSDLASDIAVIAGLRFSQKPSDHNHLYGHHRFSTLAQLLIALLLITVAGGIVYQSALSLQNPQPAIPGTMVVIAAIASLVIKEWLYQWTIRVARRHKSKLLEANAWHHRSDGASSLLVLIALLAITFGGERWAFLDPTIGIGLGIVLIIQGLRQSKDALDNLMDAAPAQEIIEDFREHILSIEGAIAYHNFRVRSVGDLFEVDMHLQVSPELTVQQGHDIASEVRDTLCQKHPEVLSVLIHIEPATPRHIKPKGISDAEQAQPGSSV